MIRFLTALLLPLWLALSTPAHAAEWVAAPAEQDLSVALLPPPPVPEEYIELHGLHAKVRGHPRDRATLQRLANHASRSVPDIAERLGIGTGPLMRITLVDSQPRFAQLQPGDPPRWADGTAYPQRALIFLRSPKLRDGTATPLEQVLDHEITHVLLGQAYGARPVPRWLQEGLAQWVAGEYGPETTRRISRGRLGGGLLKLEDITRGFPSDPMRADLAYAQSADLIAFVATEYGEQAIPDLVQSMAKGTPVNAAFRDATGDFAHEIDREWRARLESSNALLSTLGSETFWWGAGAPILLVGYLMARRRNRRRLDEWRREEALQEALYKAIERSMAPGAPPRPRPREPWQRRPDNDHWVH